VIPDKAVKGLQQYGGTVLKSSLSKDAEAQLQDALQARHRRVMVGARSGPPPARRQEPAAGTGPERPGLVLAALILVAADANLNLAVANVALLDMGVRPLDDLHLEDLGQVCAARRTLGVSVHGRAAADRRRDPFPLNPDRRARPLQHPQRGIPRRGRGLGIDHPRRSASAARVPSSCVASGPPR
jgi:hypothetical protein